MEAVSLENIILLFTNSYKMPNIHRTEIICSIFGMLIDSKLLSLQVRYLQIAKKSQSYNPYRWVRYVTQTNSYVARLWKSLKLFIPWATSEAVKTWYWQSSSCMIVLL